MTRRYTRARKVCNRCKGRGVLYRTDGTPIVCPVCDGACEVDD